MPATPARPVRMSSVVTIFSALSSSFFYSAFLLSFLRCSLAPRLPAHPCSTRHAPVVVLSFSCPLSPLVLLLACSPHVVLLSFWSSSVTACPAFVFLMCLRSSFCLLLPSSCHPLVFRLSCRCRAVDVAVCGRGRPPPQQPQFLPTKQFGVYAGIMFLNKSENDPFSIWVQRNIMETPSHHVVGSQPDRCSRVFETKQGWTLLYQLHSTERGCTADTCCRKPAALHAYLTNMTHTI